MSNMDFDLLAHTHLAAPEFVSGKGACYYTAEGKEYVDLNEMRVVLGQSNEAFENAMIGAVRSVTSMRGDGSAKAELLGWLNKTTGGRFAAAHLAASGSETVENAVRVAKKLTGHTEIISFWNSIHGRGYLSASMSGVPKRKAFYGPLAPGLVHVPYPNCAHCPLRRKKGACDMACLELVKDIYASASAQDGAAIIVELCQANGVVLPPPGYMKALQDWAKSQGMLFIVDEMQSGMGRSGHTYLYEKEGLEPDILLLGKALGNGQHISAMLVGQVPEKKDLDVFTGGSGDDPVACRAACEVFRQLDEGLLDHIRQVGNLLVEGLKELEGDARVLETRGVGLSAAVEFDTADTCAWTCAALLERGFLVGCLGNVLFLKPPYVITAEHVEAFVKNLKEILS